MHYAIVLWSLLVPTQSPDYAETKRRAEVYYAERSYNLAREGYAVVDQTTLEPSEIRWVRFRLADTQWRSEAATRIADESRIDEARSELESLIAEASRDRVWVECQESLGDSHARRGSSTSSQARNYYWNALTWWSEQRDRELARARYEALAFKLPRPRLRALENVLKIATDPNTRARAHVGIATELQGQREGQFRVAAEYESAIAIGRASEWYDDALYGYAQWLERPGVTVVNDDGQHVRDPDFLRALSFYRQLVDVFQRSESRHYDDAVRRIRDITSPTLDVSVSQAFLPGSPSELTLRTRNVPDVRLSVYAIDLFGEPHAWTQNLPERKLRQWRHPFPEHENHRPQIATVRVPGVLDEGAYAVVAESGDVRKTGLLLVTDASLVMMDTVSGEPGLLYFCDALDGSPIQNADVRLWMKREEDEAWGVSSLTTDGDGMVAFTAHEDMGHNDPIYAVAKRGDRLAFVSEHARRRERGRPWRIDVVSDRPVYRPGDTVHWKVTARVETDSGFVVPSERTLTYRIHGGRGVTVDEGTLTLNGFGSAWSSLEVDESMSLGEYSVYVFTEDERRGGGGRLFRLEEYKLPEFKVAVDVPTDSDGNKRAYRLGDAIDVSVSATYYSGGAVKDANVDVVIRERPFHSQWHFPTAYAWYAQPTYYGRGQGRTVQETYTRTDADGKATVSIQTPRFHRTDLEYVIEAQVTDASRREIRAMGTVRASRQAFFLYARASHRILRRGERARIDFKAVDANENGVAATGAVRVTREIWQEAWLDDKRRPVSESDVNKARRQRSFPPRGWTMTSAGYESVLIVETDVVTDGGGDAVFRFMPEEPGFYKVSWRTEERHRPPVVAETGLWVTARDVHDLEFRADRVQILLDRDTATVGDRIPVLLSAPVPGAHVVFCTEVTALNGCRLVRMRGTIERIEIPVREEHTPNFFLSTAMVHRARLYRDHREITVPPEAKFLTVDLGLDKEVYAPGEDAKVRVQVRDHDGAPVEAEVSLGVVDEALYYIQESYAPDPRAFFYGQRRYRRARTASTFSRKSYADLRDESLLRPAGGGVGKGVVGGVPGGVVGGGIGGLYRSFANADTYMDNAQIVSEIPAPAQASGPEIDVRTDFRSTVYWQPDVVTSADGSAEAQFEFSDSLTTWSSIARVITKDTRVGTAAASVSTDLPFIARLQAPRFFVVGDETQVSAVVQNRTGRSLRAKAELDLDGLEPVSDQAQEIALAPDESSVVDWNVNVTQPGNATVRVVAAAANIGDGMERGYRVYEHGIDKLVARSGRSDAEALRVSLDLPADRASGTTALALNVTPSLAVTLLDALPYLIDYPYGCVEQTMSRFLPAVITKKTLEDLGVNPQVAMARAFGGIEKASAEATHPDGKRDLAELDAIVDAGLKRLYSGQGGDGGWGWWARHLSDRFMTGYVVWGLSLAREAGIDVDENVLRRGARFLALEIVEEELRPDIQAWMLHAYVHYNPGTEPAAARAFENLWERRDALNAYTRALLTLTAHRRGDLERAEILARNLQNGVQLDTSPDTSVVQRGPQTSHSAVMTTAHWGDDGIRYRWSSGGVEATSFALQALMAVAPESRLVEPAMHWLIRNRRGSQWSNTRDTAIAILALNDYLRTSGELGRELSYELRVNDHVVGSRRLTADDIFTAPSRFVVDPELIEDEVNVIDLTRVEGDGPLYFSAEARFFSTEEPVTPSGHEIFVRRQYYKVVAEPTLLSGVVYDYLPLGDADTVHSGDIIEVVLTVEAKNNYEYLVFEDLKPAGFEAVDVRSGEPMVAREVRADAVRRGLNPMRTDEDFTRRARYVHQELRDRKVASFVDKLPQGIWEIRYQMRAETPGRFHALPVTGHAMYVPEIRANGAETHVEIIDPPAR